MQPGMRMMGVIKKAMRKVKRKKRTHQNAMNSVKKGKEKKRVIREYRRIPLVEWRVRAQKMQHNPIHHPYTN